MSLEEETDRYQRQDQLVEAVKRGDIHQCQIELNQWTAQSSTPFKPAKDLAPVLAAATSSKNTQMVSFLLHQGAPISSSDALFALRGEDTEATIALLQTFLDHGWDINGKTDIGKNILVHVIANETLTRWFLAHGADVNAIGKVGSTILDVAAANSSPAIFDLLVQHGARLEDSDALHSAAGARETKEGRVEMMKHLLDLGVFDVNALERREYPPSRRRGRGTPLHNAVLSEDVERLRLLLAYGTDLERENTMGETAEEFAADRGFKISEAFLKDAAASKGRTENVGA
ncbi:uncharacterized protein KY384_000388 [Bacidia gigantensis]|uniref:uncharacterized protein n=1 Tax=Bacidia gigantensis TaxID=2732470 RepID=UPI001D058DD4|nr:uncharacterized protein KY384_000388 [Bacidia gigantensis]KAG8526394.1 hypothetical protein KY384_000388 [Bacidia gigantensis]